MNLSWLLFALLPGLVFGLIELTTLNEYENARCLDGTHSGYYYEKSSKFTDRKKWVFYLYGGGECDSEQACTWALSSELGSSKYFVSNYTSSSSWYLASDYCPYNPELCTWNHVGVPYCSQDLHSGQRTTASDETWGLYFSGHLILEAILDDLDKKYDLNSASEIILTGASAGGIGVWMNIDYIAKRYRNTRVTAATIAGYYFFATYYNGENATSPGSMADFRESGIEKAYKLYDAYVDTSCKEHYESLNENPSACMLANNSIPFIESDSYAIQAQTDQTVLTGHDCWPQDYMFEAPEQQFMNDFSKNMSIGTSTLMSDNSGRKTGLFSVACYIHGDFSHTQPTINGLSYIDAFNNFYFNYDNDPSTYRLEDSCGVLCNPTCPINY